MATLCERAESLQSELNQSELRREELESELNNTQEVRDFRPFTKQRTGKSRNRDRLIKVSCWKSAVSCLILSTMIGSASALSKSCGGSAQCPVSSDRADHCGGAPARPATSGRHAGDGEKRC